MASDVSLSYGGFGQDVNEFTFAVHISGNTPSDVWLRRLYEAVAELVPDLPGFQGPIRRFGLSVSFQDGHSIDIDTPMPT